MWVFERGVSGTLHKFTDVLHKSYFYETYMEQLCVFLLGKTIDEFDNKFSFNIPLNLCT
jgi:hypothetical protein